VRTRDHDGLQGLRLILAALRRGCVLRKGSTRNTHGSDGTQRKGRLYGLGQLTAVESHCTLQTFVDV
jgi:hypothetical protein